MYRMLIAYAVLALVAASAATAALPETMSYQGVLTDTSGGPLDGNVLLTFRIYDQESGGTALWDEAQTVSVDDGLFDVILGSDTPIELDFDVPYWLGIEVEAESELTPRHELAAVPYAHTAIRVESDVVSSLDGVSNDEGNIDLVEGSNITITPDDGANTITISASGGGGLSGSGTANAVAKFTDSTTLGDSSITDDGSEVNIVSRVDVDDRMTLDSDSGALGSTIGLSVVTHAYSISTVNDIDGAWGKTVAEAGYERKGLLYGVSGSAENGYESHGVWAYATGAETYNYGVRARANGTYPGSTNYGIYADVVNSQPGTNYAGYFDGDVTVTGTLTEGGGSLKIDHPLHPESMYLSHATVVSPDMMTVYNGNVTLDGAGEAIVELPDWFESLNRDFRYQLTCIGGFAPVYVAEEISGQTFRIAGGDPGMKVSWMVTGIRRDAWAKTHPIEVEAAKTVREIGKYIHPEALGFDRAMSVTHRPDGKAHTE